LSNKGFELEELEDEKVVLICQAGDMEAVDYIFNKYKNLVKKKAREYYIIGGDHDDLFQEGMLALWDAIKGYKEGAGASFYTFALLCITRRLINVVKHDNTCNSSVLNTFSNIDDVEDEVGYEQSPEDYFFGKLDEKAVMDAIESALSSYEVKVFKLYIEGYDYVDIAKILDKTPKSVDNAMQRLKGKAKACVNSRLR